MLSPQLGNCARRKHHAPPGHAASGALCAQSARPMTYPNRNSLYGRRWRKARKIFLAANPLCKMCEQKGRVETATDVDHIEPHKGDYDKFWDQTNWQALCEACHHGTKQADERRGYSTEIGADGWPVDPKHPSRATS